MVGFRLRWPALAHAEWALLRWLLPLALLQGLLYLFVTPPWEHYDEPGHFLYAAEIAAGELHARGPAAVAISREVADSMYRHGFLDGAFRPDLLAPGPVRVGEDQRVHPPLYYALVAAPLRVVRFLAIETQLYTARVVSLLLYVLTIVAAWRIAVVLAPGDPLAQALLPALVLLVPTFADLMTAVNNDVLLNFAVTVAFLGAVHLVRDGLRPVPLLLALLGLTVAVAAKRTGLAATIPVGLALLWAVRRAPLRPWMLLVGAGMAAVVAATALRPVVVGQTVLIEPRPWLEALDQRYLRLSLDAWLRSVSDIAAAIQPSQALVVVGFTSFWGRLSWGNVALPAPLDGVFAVLCLAAGCGLLLGLLRGREEPLVERRIRWIFVVAVAVGVLALFARLHPLPPPGVDAYIPRGRYLFWAIVPVVYLMAYGIQHLVPERWRGLSLWVLAGVLALSNLVALATLVAYFGGRA
ncbi:MAG: glycosyltransferase family 39 protein [Chloroflexi bacterium OHK40]